MVGGERYTGRAAWTRRGSQGVEVTFAASDVIFWADPGRFGSYGWNELKMVTCDGDSWGMALNCGSTTEESPPPCISSEAVHLG